MNFFISSEPGLFPFKITLTTIIIVSEHAHQSYLTQILNAIDPKSILKYSQSTLSGRVLDSRPRGCGFKPHRRHCAVVLE